MTSHPCFFHYQSSLVLLTRLIINMGVANHFSPAVYLLGHINIFMASFFNSSSLISPSLVLFQQFLLYKTCLLINNYFTLKAIYLIYQSNIPLFPKNIHLFFRLIMLFTRVKSCDDFYDELFRLQQLCPHIILNFAAKTMLPHLTFFPGQLK